MKKSQIKKLDDLFGKKIRSIGKCEWCGLRDFPNIRTLQTAHIISRKYMHVRWDEENARCLCARCHRKAHDNPLSFADWVFDEIGKNKYYELVRRSQDTSKLFYEDILEELNGKITR